MADNAETGKQNLSQGRGVFLTSTLVLSLLFLSACGFQPVYTPQDTSAGRFGAAADLYATQIMPIQDREGQILHNLLLDNLNPYGPPQNPFYTLKTALSVRSVGVGLRADATSTRNQLRITATATLSGAGEAKQFNAFSTSSFNTIESDYGSLVAEEDAVERSLQQIADDLTVQIAAFFKKARQQDQ